MGRFYKSLMLLVLSKDDGLEGTVFWGGRGGVFSGINRGHLLLNGLGASPTLQRVVRTGRIPDRLWLRI